MAKDRAVGAADAVRRLPRESTSTRTPPRGPWGPWTTTRTLRAASRAEEGAQHPLLGVMIDHPFLKSPDDDQEQRELQATYYGMLVAEVQTAA